MKIKRFATLIIALALLTTGGVFAAWNFAGSNAGSANSPELQFGMENAEYSTSSGRYSVTTNGQKVFTIDQTKVDTVNPANNDYTAKLVVNPAAEITITFTPNKGASQVVLDNGILSEFYFSFKKGVTQTPYTMDANGNYTTENPASSVPIIVLDQTRTQINAIADNPEANKIYWTKSSDGLSFTYVMKAEEIAKHVALNPDAVFVLDTIEEYNAFGTCLDGGYTCAVVVQDPLPTTSES